MTFSQVRYQNLKTKKLFNYYFSLLEIRQLSVIIYHLITDNDIINVNNKQYR